MPSGGDGFYYFSIYLLVDSDEWGRFNIEMNGDMLCSAQTDNQSTASDEGQAACSAATYVAAGLSINRYDICVEFSAKVKTILYCFSLFSESTGDTVQVVYDNGVDETPLWENTAYYWNGFTGFRI